GEHEERLLSFVVLNVIDEKWRDHLYDLDHLKASIGFRGWGQKDPLIEYKQEAYSMFVDFMTDVRKSVATTVFRMQLRMAQPAPAAPRRLILTGPSDAPGLRPAASQPAPEAAADGAVPGPRPAAGSRLIRAAPLGNAAAAGPDPRRMQTNRGEEPAAAKPVSAEPKVGRNDPCPCGSGRKYKKCHGAG